MNTKSSAIDILDSRHYWTNTLTAASGVAVAPFYPDLHKRIESCLLREQYIQHDLTQAANQNNPLLQSVLEKHREQNKAMLDKFIRLIVNISGNLPSELEKSYQLLVNALSVAGLIPEDLPQTANVDEHEPKSEAPALLEGDGHVES